MSLYLDTSVLVALHLEERASAAVARLVAETTAPLLVSNLAAAEFAAALAGRVRRQSITDSQAEVMLRAFERDTLDLVEWVEIASADVLRAAQLVRIITPKLRVPDAIHIAMCIRLDASLVSSDLDQLEAARFHQISVVEPT